MASKFSKVLFGSAVAGAAIAGGLTYLLKKKEKENSWDEDLEDFDDNMTEDKKDEEDDTPISREYVTIHTEHSQPEEAGEGEEAFAEEPESSDSTIKDSVAAAMQNVADRVDNDIAESMTAENEDVHAEEI